MSIVQNTDFIVNEALPIDNIEDKLDAYITRYEKKILIKVLGYELYKEFNTAIEGVSPDQKWIDLRDGAEYGTSPNVEFFDGLIQLAMRYIYFKFISENQVYATGTGMKRNSSENSVNADPGIKQEYAYNEMVNINNRLFDFINDKNTGTPDTYENYEPVTIEKITHFNF